MGYHGHPTGCGCGNCSSIRAAKRITTRRRRERQRNGDVPSIAAVHAHVTGLLQAGWTQRGIAAASGVTTETIGRMASGKGAYVLHTTAEAILAVGTATARIRDHGRIPAAGTRRRLQALAAIGHPIGAVAVRAGIGPKHASTIACGKQARTSIKIAQAVAAVYDELWNRPGPSPIAKGHARARGWVPPLAWDDDAIDDPGALPQLGAPTPRTLALAEDAAELLAQGIPLAAAAERLNVRLPALKQAIYRARRSTDHRAGAAA